MPRDARKVVGNLLQKGFRQRNSGDKFFHLYADGKKTTVWTYISHGEKEIHDGLLAQMAKQTKLVKKEFLELVDCPMSEARYIELLRERNHIAKPSDEKGSAKR